MGFVLESDVAATTVSTDNHCVEFGGELKDFCVDMADKV